MKILVPVPKPRDPNAKVLRNCKGGRITSPERKQRRREDRRLRDELTEILSTVKE